MTLLDFALRYAAAGFRVLPVRRDKIPYTKHGSHDASIETLVIRAWWAQWPDANIGMTLDGMVVVDIDPRNGGDADTLPHKLTDTCYARTGGGGLHYLYRAHNGTKYPGTLGAGIDVKSGPGAYIVVEPSLHVSGDKYNWLDETEPWATTPAEAPEWLAIKQQGHAEARSEEREHGQGWRTWLDAIARGDTLHDSLRALAAHYAALGLVFAEICSVLELAMHASKAPRDERWNERFAGIPKLVNSAIEKFRAPSKEWPNPQDIFRDVIAAPFSLDDVPESVAQFADAFSTSTGFDRSAVISVAVAAAGAVIDDRYRLAVRHGSGWFESARLWVALIGGPSAGKSPTIRAATDPIKNLHREQWAIWLKENNGLKPEERTAEPCLYSSDATLEALSDVLKHNPRGVLMLTEEFSSWIGSIDAYRNGQGSRDRGEMLQLYDGGPHQVHRVKRGSFLVQNWGASVIAAGTPAGLRQQVKQLPDDGLIHRFIPCIMQRPQAAGPGSIKAPLEAWGRTLRHLFETTSTSSATQRARFTTEASALFEAEAAALREATANAEGIAPALASHFGKHPGMIARVALTFHLLRMEKGEGIAGSTVKMACKFMRTVRKHAAALYLDILQVSPVRELARSVGRSLAATTDTSEDISRAWLSSHCRQFRDADDQQRRAAVEFLEDANWIRPLPNSRPYGGWSATAWALNPKVFARFATVGAEHKARRENVNAAIFGAD